MAQERRDYVERMIEELAAVVARLVGRLGAGTPDAADEVVLGAQAAQGELLGSLAAALPQVDAASAVTLLRDPRQARAWVELLRVEAAARRLRGENAAALALEARAAELVAAITTAGVTPGEGGTPPPRPTPPR